MKYAPPMAGWFSINGGPSGIIQGKLRRVGEQFELLPGVVRWGSAALVTVI